VEFQQPPGHRPVENKAGLPQVQIPDTVIGQHQDFYRDAWAIVYRLNELMPKIETEVEKTASQQ
jgi:hypothetical protein